MALDYRHVALTGQPGVGKTTLVEKIVSMLQESKVPSSGFYTEEVRSNGRRVGFDVVTLEGQRSQLSRIKKEGSSSAQAYCVGQYVVNLPAFESLAIPVVSRKVNTGEVLVVDEVGKMEGFSKKFVQMMRQHLDSPSSTLLITIPVAKGHPIPLVEQIRNHRCIFVVTVTRENRDSVDLLNKIVRILSSTHK